MYQDKKQTQSLIYRFLPYFKVDLVYKNILYQKSSDMNNHLIIQNMITMDSDNPSQPNQSDKAIEEMEKRVRELEQEKIRQARQKRERERQERKEAAQRIAKETEMETNQNNFMEKNERKRTHSADYGHQKKSRIYINKNGVQVLNMKSSSGKFNMGLNMQVPYQFYKANPVNTANLFLAKQNGQQKVFSCQLVDAKEIQKEITTSRQSKKKINEEQIKKQKIKKSKRKHTELNPLYLSVQKQMQKQQSVKSETEDDYKTEEQCEVEKRQKSFESNNSQKYRIKRNNQGEFIKAPKLKQQCENSDSKQQKVKQEMIAEGHKSTPKKYKFINKYYSSQTGENRSNFQSRTWRTIQELRRYKLKLDQGKISQVKYDRICKKVNKKIEKYDAEAEQRRMMERPVVNNRPYIPEDIESRPKHEQLNYELRQFEYFNSQPTAWDCIMTETQRLEKTLSKVAAPLLRKKLEGKTDSFPSVRKRVATKQENLKMVEIFMNQHKKKGARQLAEQAAKAKGGVDQSKMIPKKKSGLDRIPDNAEAYEKEQKQITKMFKKLEIYKSTRPNDIFDYLDYDSEDEAQKQKNKQKYVQKEKQQIYKQSKPKGRKYFEDEDMQALSELRKITGYNPSSEKFRQRDRQRIVESNFDQIRKEDYISKKLGRKEEAEARAEALGEDESEEISSSADEEEE